MTWLPVIVLAAVTFAIAAFVLRTPKRGWTLIAAVLVFGLAGYALQGSPDLAAAPKAGQDDGDQSGEARS